MKRKHISHVSSFFQLKCELNCSNKSLKDVDLSRISIHKDAWLTFADWDGEEEQGSCEGDAGRPEGAHGAAAETGQAVGGSALGRLLLTPESPHLPLAGLPFLFGRVRLTSCSSESSCSHVRGIWRLVPRTLLARSLGCVIQVRRARQQVGLHACRGMNDGRMKELKTKRDIRKT